ncbi:hypothetical protein BDBG_16583 [Blastomyces gilchristii SLH14081]|uniref:Uncharacterized protein n=2 Tax=Blastomyces TaxID=229219 RepID=A0A179UE12_BLAGS|nr:uncharacterized protein BDBG_16583 [Blastomyces gilchristii SLH14081]KMW67317.1 hypothetical protein BDDG_12047 [Blastomyces dermatitidis ATCC 18188]OAT06256.1 hypothetical protein BDBG_16583 [Blastomyces gilchristii SLH14081]
MAAANWHAADWSHKRIKQGHILPRRTSLSLAFGIGNHSGNLRNEWERWYDGAGIMELEMKLHIC